MTSDQQVWAVLNLISYPFAAILFLWLFYPGENEPETVTVRRVVNFDHLGLPMDSHTSVIRGPGLLLGLFRLLVSTVVWYFASYIAPLGLLFLWWRSRSI